MSLNCKSGDLAQVTRCTDKWNRCKQALIGRTIVTVTIPIFTDSGVFWQFAEGSVACPVNPDHCRFSELADADLKPFPKPEAEGESDPVAAPLDAPVVLPVVETEPARA